MSNTWTSLSFHREFTSMTTPKKYSSRFMALKRNSENQNMTTSPLWPRSQDLMLGGESQLLNPLSKNEARHPQSRQHPSQRS
jgi:hypothetical protein